MIVDTSALIAILNDEVDAPALAAALVGSSTSIVPAPALLEASIVAGPSRHADLDELLDAMGATVAPFADGHVETARDAYARFGRGSGSPAALNYGECMVYAVAKVSGEPLLFKGDDFRHTDIEAVL